MRTTKHDGNTQFSTATRRGPKKYNRKMETPETIRTETLTPLQFSKNLLEKQLKQQVAPTSAPRKRSLVKTACVNCRKAKSACDEERPCRRCTRLSLTATCCDVRHRKSGRPRKNATTTDAAANKLSSSFSFDVPQANTRWKFNPQLFSPQVNKSSPSLVLNRILHPENQPVPMNVSLETAALRNCISNFHVEASRSQKEVEQGRSDVSSLASVLQFLHRAPQQMPDNTNERKARTESANVITRLGQSQDGNKNAVIVRGMDGNVWFANEIAKKIFGVTSQNELGSTWLDVLSFFPVDKFEEASRELRATMVSNNSEFVCSNTVIQTPQQERLAVTQHIRLIRAEDGSGICLFFTYTAI